MQLFYQPLIKEGVYYLDEEESNHCKRVLRKKLGDLIDVGDGQGSIYTVSITELKSNKCHFEIQGKKEYAATPYRIHIGVAPPKSSDRIEWMVEKLVEIGVSEISFFNTKNSERIKVNLQRVRKKAIAAMKQSKNAYLPQINELTSFNQFLSMEHEEVERFLCHTMIEQKNHLKYLATPKSDYIILIGPEGEFDKDEVDLALNNSFKLVSLGPNVLRTETAALVACQTLNIVQL